MVSCRYIGDDGRGQESRANAVKKYFCTVRDTLNSEIADRRIGAWNGELPGLPAARGDSKGEVRGTIRERDERRVLCKLDPFRDPFYRVVTVDCELCPCPGFQKKAFPFTGTSMRLNSTGTIASGNIQVRTDSLAE